MRLESHGAISNSVGQVFGPGAVVRRGKARLNTQESAISSTKKPTKSSNNLSAPTAKRKPTQIRKTNYQRQAIFVAAIHRPAALLYVPQSRRRYTIQ